MFARVPARSGTPLHLAGSLCVALLDFWIPMGLTLTSHVILASAYHDVVCHVVAHWRDHAVETVQTPKSIRRYFVDRRVCEYRLAIETRRFRIFGVRYGNVHRCVESPELSMEVLGTAVDVDEVE